jgi:hypothetical protein
VRSSKRHGSKRRCGCSAERRRRVAEGAGARLDGGGAGKTTPVGGARTP